MVANKFDIVEVYILDDLTDMYFVTFKKYMLTLFMINLCCK